MVPKEVEMPVQDKFRLYHLQLDAKDCKIEEGYYRMDLFPFVNEISTFLGLKQRIPVVNYVDIGQADRNHKNFIQHFDDGGYLSLIVFEDIKEVYMDFVLPEPFDSETIKEIFENTFKPVFVSLSQHARQA